MKLKSLLIGSAAALVAVSGARAADAIIAEPEPVEYVRVCDAFGAGFFYIPGTETCLQISGFVRYDININEEGWEKNTKAAINFDARSETELGTLRGYIALRADAFGDGDPVPNPAEDGVDGINPLNQSGVYLDEAFIQLGGLTIGLTYDYFDGISIGGENDSLGGAQVNKVAYDFASNGFNAGIELVDDNDDIDFAGDPDNDSDFVPNVGVTAGYASGPFEVDAVVAYDNDTEEFAAKLRANIEVTEGGKFGIAGVYASGATYTWDAAEWSIAASYTQKLSDTISASIGAQYWADEGFVAGADAFSIGANVDWTPVTNFLVRGQIQYVDSDLAGDSTVAGRIRFQRSF
ncbi:MAG: porin [Rhizobiaceae bacterium]|nr:porin [Rhizobiaceae bacterium]